MSRLGDGLVRVGMKMRVHCMWPSPVPHTRLKISILPFSTGDFPNELLLLYYLPDRDYAPTKSLAYRQLLEVKNSCNLPTGKLVRVDVVTSKK